MKESSTSTENYYCLQPGNFRLDGGAMYGIIPRPMWEKASPPDELNRIDLALRLLVHQEENRLIVVDTGIGDYHGEKFDDRFDVRVPSNPLAKSLNEIGFTPEDVTDLVLSHLHFDHVGGLGVKVKEAIKPVFPNATLHLHKDHFAYSQNPSERDSGSFHTKNFMPLIDYYKGRDQINWLDGTQGNIVGKMNFLSSNGHTPHLIHPYTDKYIYLADIIPTSNHVHIPWVMAYDIRPAISTEDKRRILDFIVENDLTLVFEHDPLYWGAKVEKTDRGFKPVTKFEAEKKLAIKI